MKSIKEAGDLNGKRVLVRVDFNVPIKDGVVEDNTRLRTALPTIQYLIEQGAKVMLITHLGRPKGQVVEELRVDLVAKELSSLLKKEVKKLDDYLGKEVKDVIEAMESGDVVLLENIRFSPEEKDNTGTLGKDLSTLADMFVLDGFGVAHRADASVVGVAAFIPAYAGLLLDKEISALSDVLNNPERPFVVLLGGKKIGTKISVLENLIKHADTILMGGALINTYLQAKGYDVCESIVDPKYADKALEYMEAPNVVTPVDWIVGQMDGSSHRVAGKDDEKRELCKPGEAIFDIGPATIDMYKNIIKDAKLIVWNGAMGYFEQPIYAKGTKEMTETVAAASKQGTYTVIGGGETLQMVESFGLTDDINHVSTGGGAMLELLAGNKLPGIAALEK